MKKLEYKNVTPEVFEGLKGEMDKIGVSISGDKGNISTKGIKGRFDRDVDNNTLEIIIDKTPFVLPESFITSKITEAITKNGGEVA